MSRSRKSIKTTSERTVPDQSIRAGSGTSDQSMSLVAPMTAAIPSMNNGDRRPREWQ
jgi:hypothetical protein